MRSDFQKRKRRAADRIRTDDNHVGNVMLCQLSYSREKANYRSRPVHGKATCRAKLTRPKSTAELAVTSRGARMSGHAWISVILCTFTCLHMLASAHLGVCTSALPGALRPTAHRNVTLRRRRDKFLRESPIAKRMLSPASVLSGRYFLSERCFFSQCTHPRRCFSCGMSFPPPFSYCKPRTIAGQG